MHFKKLNETLPYVTGGKKHYLSAVIYPAIEISMPGRHQNDTIPAGGDGVILISDDTLEWTKHQFTHDDIFYDVQAKIGIDDKFWEAYLNVIKGEDPNDYNFSRDDWAGGMHPQTFLYASQVLSVIEHRRYAKYEPQFGGRYLPFRFAAGIAEGLWDVDAAVGMQRKGRPGVEQLEKFNGLPLLTKELMTND